MRQSQRLRIDQHKKSETEKTEFNRLNQTQAGDMATSRRSRRASRIDEQEGASSSTSNLVLAGIVIHQFLHREFDLHLTGAIKHLPLGLAHWRSKNPQNQEDSFAGRDSSAPARLATELLANDFRTRVNSLTMVLHADRYGQIRSSSIRAKVCSKRPVLPRCFQLAPLVFAADISNCARATS